MVCPNIFVVMKFLLKDEAALKSYLLLSALIYENFKSISSILVILSFEFLSLMVNSIS